MGKVSTQVVNFRNRGMVQVVTFVYLIYWWVSFVFINCAK